MSTKGKYILFGDLRRYSKYNIQKYVTKERVIYFVNWNLEFQYGKNNNIKVIKFKNGKLRNMFAKYVIQFNCSCKLTKIDQKKSHRYLSGKEIKWPTKM